MGWTSAQDIVEQLLFKSCSRIVHCSKVVQSMFKVCSRCQKVHPFNQPCSCAKYKKNIKDGNERKLRRTNAWKEKSLQIREQADNLCEVCRDKGRFIYNNLEVHHIHKIKDAPERYLDDENLICLCGSCHKDADKGLLKIDYLERLAQRRNEK